VDAVEEKKDIEAPPTQGPLHREEEAEWISKQNAYAIFKHFRMQRAVEYTGDLPIGEHLVWTNGASTLVCFLLF
jgi:hypothetical protein